MLTGRAAELRPWINYLHPHPIVLVSPEQARAQAMARPATAENAETLKTRGRMANMRRRTARRTRDSARAAVLAERGVAMIPTSGAARRRAKACRNRDAVAGMTASWTDVTDTVTDGWTVVRGRQYEGGPVSTWNSVRRGYSDLLAEVLDWCSDHPHGWHPLPESGALPMHRADDGTITVEGDAPEFLAVSADLLAAASRDYLTFTDGVLAIDVQPETLHYRPLGPDPRSRVIVFERVREAP
jgi:hypothetical protein